MTLAINKYRGYSAATIKARATIPDQADLTVSGDDVVYNNISMEKIRDGIGAAILEQIALSDHANVNHWSGFGPTRRREVDGMLVNDVVAPHGKCEFAGYNHNAPAPGFSNSAHLTDRLVYGAGSGAYFTADIIIGEPRYIDGDIENHGNCVGIALTVWDGANLVGFGIEDLSALQNFANLSANVPAIYTNKTFTCKIFLTDSTTAFNQNGDNIICQVPGLDDWQADAYIVADTYLNLQAGSFTVTGGGFNMSAGSCGFSDAYYASNIPDLEVIAKLFNYKGELVGSEILWPKSDDPYFPDGDYDANYHMGGRNAVLNGGNPVGSSGWTFQILFNEPY